MKLNLDRSKLLDALEDGRLTLYDRLGNVIGELVFKIPHSVVKLEDGSEIRHYSLRDWTVQDCRYMQGSNCTYPHCECEWR